LGIIGEGCIYCSQKILGSSKKNCFFRTNYFDIVGDALTWFKTERLRTCMFEEEREHIE
jgi:hypothetical protein